MIDEDDDAAQFDLGAHLSTPVEDHFKAASSQSITKDWEVRSRVLSRAGVRVGVAPGGAHSNDNNFLLSELSSLKTQLGEIPSVPLRVFKRISFKRKREDSSSSGTAAEGSAATEGGEATALKDWEVLWRHF